MSEVDRADTAVGPYDVGLDGPIRPIADDPDDVGLDVPVRPIARLASLQIQETAPAAPAVGPETSAAATIARYWPAFAVKDLVTAGIVLAVVVLLSIFLVPRQVVTDPIYRTALPSPDWLYLFYFLPYMYLQGVWQLPALLMIPPLTVVLLLLVPFLQRDNPTTARRRFYRKIVVLTLAVALIGTAFVTTASTGARVPAQGCEACHRPRMVGAPPAEVKGLGHRDSQWIARHLFDPQYWWMQ